MIGLHFEDFAEGQVIEVGSYTFTAENIARFCDNFVPVPFHVNDEEAAKSMYGGHAAPGLHTCSAWMICFVTHNTRAREALAAQGHALPELGPSPGLEKVRWPKPIHPGDVVSYRNTVVGKRELSSRPRWGMLTFLAEGHNQRSELVMSFVGKVLVARRA